MSVFLAPHWVHHEDGTIEERGGAPGPWNQSGQRVLYAGGPAIGPYRGASKRRASDAELRHAVRNGVRQHRPAQMGKTFYCDGCLLDNPGEVFTLGPIDVCVPCSKEFAFKKTHLSSSFHSSSPKADSPEKTPSSPEKAPAATSPQTKFTSTTVTTVSTATPALTISNDKSVGASREQKKVAWRNMLLTVGASEIARVIGQDQFHKLADYMESQDE